MVSFVRERFTMLFGPFELLVPQFLSLRPRNAYFGFLRVGSPRVGAALSFFEMFMASCLPEALRRCAMLTNKPTSWRQMECQ
jgi:hypothetical protein